MKLAALSLVVLSFVLDGSCAGDTDDATNITATSAVLNGHGTTSTGSGSYCFKHWRANDVEPAGCAPIAFSGAPNTTRPVQQAVSGLLPNTTYQFRVCGKESNASSMTCAPTRAFTTLRDTLVLALEAENGALHGALVRINQTGVGASGDSFVIDNSTAATKANAFATYTFHVTTAGAYYLWARTFAPSHNDFRVAVDSAAATYWAMPPSNRWAWNRLATAPGSPDPLVLNLSAGAHTVTFFGLALKGKIDRVLLANELSYAPGVSEEAMPVDMVWSGVGTTRTLFTTKTHQYVAYYNRARYLTVAQRLLTPNASWKYKVLDGSVGGLQFSGWDNHHEIEMTVDPTGSVHLIGNFHNSGITGRYFKTNGPDIDTFAEAQLVSSLDGPPNATEDDLTYPRFIERGGNLFLITRDGFCGNGDVYLDIYDHTKGTWSRAVTLFKASNPIDKNLDQDLNHNGIRDYLEGQSPYETIEFVNGVYHMAWVWKYGGAWRSENSIHSVSYAKSTDLIHWTNVDGKPVPLPITPSSPGVLVDEPYDNWGITNTKYFLAVDAAGKPTLAYHKFVEVSGVTSSQIFLARPATTGFQIVQATGWNCMPASWNPRTRDKASSGAVGSSVLTLQADGTLTVNWIRTGCVDNGAAWTKANVGTARVSYIFQNPGHAHLEDATAVYVAGVDVTQKPSIVGHDAVGTNLEIPVGDPRLPRCDDGKDYSADSLDTARYNETIGTTSAFPAYKNPDPTSYFMRYAALPQDRLPNGAPDWHGDGDPPRMNTARNPPTVCTPAPTPLRVFKKRE